MATNGECSEGRHQVPRLVHAEGSMEPYRGVPRHRAVVREDTGRPLRALHVRKRRDCNTLDAVTGPAYTLHSTGRDFVSVSLTRFPLSPEAKPRTALATFPKIEVRSATENATNPPPSLSVGTTPA
jgi:hypothetical protein